MKVLSKASSLLAGCAVAALAAFGGAGSALADGGPGGRVVYERPYNWSGLYFGVHAGWVWSETNAFFPDGNPALQIVGVPGRGFGANHDAPMAGGQIGLQHQFGQIVLGVEGGFSTAYQDNPGVDLCPKQTIALFNCTARFDDVLTVGGRLGWAMGKWMPYVTGGYASARFTEQANNKSLAPVATTIVSWAQERAQGWYIGGGAEWALSHGWVVGVEYRHYDFDSHTGLANAIVGGVAGGPIPNDNVVLNHHADTIALRVSWKLGRPEPAPLK
jgi:outer membrane immunogenic protein